MVVDPATCVVSMSPMQLVAQAVKNKKTILNNRLFTTKHLPSKNIYLPKDFLTPSICDIHCPIASAVELDHHRTIPLGLNNGHQNKYLL